MQRTLDEEVKRYVRTGEHDNHLFLGWPGSNLGERGERGHAALGSALVAEVRRRTPHAAVPDALHGLDVQASARAKLAPMVHGLFPRSEHRFEDFVVHEAAHVFHNWKRETLGLPHTRWKEQRERPPADRVDPDEYVDILRETVAARNGWKRILARCAPPRRTRRGDPT
jgi:hypothetical protein